MTRVPTAPLAVLFLLPVLSGCVDTTRTTNAGTLPDPVEAPFDYVNATWPTAAGAYAELRDFIMTTPYRRTEAGIENPFMDAARSGIEERLGAAGLTVARHQYGTGVNLLGIKEAPENPDQWVVLGGHYDSAESTVYGAWDNGAGVSLLLELARSLGTWEFPFTLVFAFWDEEEKGLIGSKAFVRDFAPEKDILAYVNTDPPGLNWPCGDAMGPYNFFVSYQAEKTTDEHPRYPWLMTAVNAALNASEVPRDVRLYQWFGPFLTVAGAGFVGASDHFSFDGRNIASVSLGGEPVTRAGPVEWGSYAAHTPLDTLQHMEQRCAGGAGSVEDALGVVGDVMARTVITLATTEAPSA